MCRLLQEFELPPELACHQLLGSIAAVISKWSHTYNFLELYSSLSTLWREYDSTVKRGGFLTRVVTEAEVVFDVVRPILRPSPLAPVPYQAFVQWATEIFSHLQLGAHVSLQDCLDQGRQLLTHMLPLDTPTTLDQYQRQPQQYTQLAATFGAASGHQQPRGGNAMMLETDWHLARSPAYQSPTPPEAFRLQRAATQRLQRDVESQLTPDHDRPDREQRYPGQPHPRQLQDGPSSQLPDRDRDRTRGPSRPQGRPTEWPTRPNQPREPQREDRLRQPRRTPRSEQMPREDQRQQGSRSQSIDSVRNSQDSSAPRANEDSDRMGPTTARSQQTAQRLPRDPSQTGDRQENGAAQDQLAQPSPRRLPPNPASQSQHARQEGRWPDNTTARQPPPPSIVQGVYPCGPAVNGGVSDGHVAMVATSYKGPAPGSDRNIPLLALAWQIAPVYDITTLVDSKNFSVT